MVTTRRVAVLVRVEPRDAATEELRLALIDTLSELNDVDTVSADYDARMGANTREIVANVVLAYSVSVAANLATPTIQEALASFENVVIELVQPDPDPQGSDQDGEAAP